MRRLLLPLVALLALPLAATAQVPGNGGLVQAAPSPRGNPNVGIEEKIGQPIPLDLQFRDEGGRPVLLRNCFLPGKPAILVLGYYRCPMLCGQIQQGLLEAMIPMPLTAGKDFTVINLSFDPKEHHEIAADKRKAFVQQYGRVEGDAGVRFLTGDRRAIEELTKSVGFKYEYDKVYKEYDHPSGLILLTPEGKVARYFYGLSYAGEYAVATEEATPKTTTLRLSLVEASEGRIGSLADRIMLSCYRFDHLERKYEFNVLLAVRIGAVLTVATLACVLFFVVRGSRRAAQLAAAEAAKPETVATGGPPAGGNS